MRRCELAIGLSLSLILMLALTVHAWEKSPETLKKLTTTLIESAAVTSSPQRLNFGETLSENAAMDALFEVVGEGKDSRYIWKNIDSPPDSAKNRSIPITQGNNGEVWALGFKELAPDRAILVTGLTELDQRGERNDCHACTGRASTFFFNRNKNKDWVLTNIELDVNQFGSHGGSGTFSFVELGPNRPGFLFDSGGTWQGYTIVLMDVFEIAKDNKTIPRTKNPIRVYAKHDCVESEPPKYCFNVEGKWSFLPGSVAGVFDLVIDFNGYTTDVKRRRRKIHQRARYRLRGTSFELIAGSNPVPKV